MPTLTVTRDEEGEYTIMNDNDNDDNANNTEKAHVCFLESPNDDDIHKHIDISDEKRYVVTTLKSYSSALSRAQSNLHGKECDHIEQTKKGNEITPSSSVPSSSSSSPSSTNSTSATTDSITVDDYSHHLLPTHVSIEPTILKRSTSEPKSANIN
jgi:hypothetical protein